MITKTVLTTQEWVKFYQDNPTQLATFIETANEEYQKLADKSQDQDSRIAELEYQLAEAKRAIFILEQLPLGITK